LRITKSLTTVTLTMLLIACGPSDGDGGGENDDNGNGNGSGTPTKVTPVYLNDSGSVHCIDPAGLIDCNSVDFPGQDSEFGRDATHRDDTDGVAGFSFTKLDNTGNALDASATEWDCVRDNVTGLIWENKVTDALQQQTNFRYMGHTFQWYNDNSAENGGDVGATGLTNICDGLLDACTTQHYIVALNDVGLCGINDWRLPTAKELYNLTNHNLNHPTIDYSTDRDNNPEANYFEFMFARYSYWSSTNAANTLDTSGPAIHAYYVDFGNNGYPSLIITGKEDTRWVMAVAEGE